MGGIIKDIATILCRSEDVIARWESLSERHVSILEELKDVIREFIEGICGSGKGKECIVPIIYGVYGSGKTTLMVELCRWILGNGIPAARVQLSDLIRYIVEVKRRNQITEDELPIYVEELFREYLRERGYGDPIKKGIIFIDEVEESYEKLRNIIIGRSVLRGLADKVRTGSTNVMAILAFAPGSVLAEAVLQYATAWRVKAFQVPLISPTSIRDKYLIPYMEKERVRFEGKLEKGEHREAILNLVSNALWWLSKGRPGWVEKVLREGLLRAMILSINYVAQGGDIRRLSSCLEPLEGGIDGDKIRDILRGGPVEAAPLMNYSNYERFLKSLEPGSRFEGLARLLPCLVGPISEDLLEELGIWLRGSKPPKEIIKTNKIISKEKLIEKYLSYAEKLEEGFEDRLRGKLREFLNSILTPWSLNDILVYDEESLKILLEEILQLTVLENMEEKLLNIVTKLDVGRIIGEAYRETPQDERRYYYALPIRVLLSLYPPTIANPLISCSKGENITRLIEELKRNSRSARESLLQYRVFKEYESKENLTVYPVFSVKDLEDLDYEIDRKIKQGGKIGLLVFSSIPALREYPKVDDIRNKLRDIYGGLLDKLIYIIDPPSVISQYLIGLLYSLISCRDKLDGQDTLEKIVMRQAEKQVQELLESIVRDYNRFRDKLQNQVREINKIKVLDLLSRLAHSRVGEEHARHIWSIAITNNSAKLLKDVINELKVIREIEDLANHYELDSLTSLTRDIRLLLDNGEKYISESENGFEELQREISKEVYSEIKEFLEGIGRLYTRSCNVDSIYNIIENIENLWRQLALPEINKAALWMLISKIIRNNIEHCDTTKVDVREPILELKTRFDELLKSLGDIYDRQSNIKELLLKIGIRIEMPSLDELLNSLRDSRNRLDALADEINNLSGYDRLRFLEYLDQLIEKRGKTSLLQRLKNLDEDLSGIKVKYVELEHLLINIIKLSNEISGIKEAVNALKEDLNQIIKESQVYGMGTKVSLSKLDNLIGDIKAYHEELNDFVKEHRSLAVEVRNIERGFEEIKKLYSGGIP